MPLFQKDIFAQNLSCENKFYLNENKLAGGTHFYQRFRTKTRFETEAKSNQKWTIQKTPCVFGFCRHHVAGHAVHFNNSSFIRALFSKKTKGFLNPRNLETTVLNQRSVLKL